MAGFSARAITNPHALHRRQLLGIEMARDVARIHQRGASVRCVLLDAVPGQYVGHRRVGVERQTLRAIHRGAIGVEGIARETKSVVRGGIDADVGAHRDRSELACGLGEDFLRQRAVDVHVPFARQSFADFRGDINVTLIHRLPPIHRPSHAPRTRAHRGSRCGRW